MFISHFHCLTLVQPSLIHLWTIRTAFQLVPLVARDPPLPIHPTYFVSGNLPKTPLSFSSLGRLSSSITLRLSKIQIPSILLNLIPFVLNIYSLIQSSSSLHKPTNYNLSWLFLSPLVWHAFIFLCHQNSASSRPSSNPFSL